MSSTPHEIEITESSESRSYFSRVFSPLRSKLYCQVWLAASFSYIGTWMHNLGAGWLMASLTKSSTLVALVQTATTLPILLFAIPGGILANQIALPKYIGSLQLMMGMIAIGLGIFTFLHFTTPWLLLTFTFLLGTGSALVRPAWLTAIPQLVPKTDLQQAFTLNSINFNLARLIGPTIGGFIIELWNTATVFLLNGLSFLGMVYVFFRWQRHTVSTAAAETYSLQKPRREFTQILKLAAFRIILLRTILFFIGSSTLWAFLPLVARYQLQGNANSYGLMISSLSLGAIMGGMGLTYCRSKWSTDTLTAIATLFVALLLLMLPYFHHLSYLFLWLGLGGFGWITMVSTLNNLAVEIVPEQTRSKAVSLYIVAFSGSQAVGSFLWGMLADHFSFQKVLVSSALFLFIGMATIPLWRLDKLRKLQN